MEKQSKRQTNLSFQQISDFLKSRGHGYSRCLLVNEVGTSCKEEGDKDGVGENMLLTLLNDKDGHCRAIAYIYISVIKDMKERNSEALDKFWKKRSNKKLKSFIQESIEKSK